MKKEGMGRIRLHVTLDCTAHSLETFIHENIEPGSNIFLILCEATAFLIKGHMSMKKTTKAVPKIMKTYMAFTWLRPW